MNILHEKARTAEFLLSEGAGEISREKITLAATATGYPSGQVLGQITANKQYAAYNPAGTDGTEKAAAVLYGSADISTDPQPATAIVRLAEVAVASLTGLDAEARADFAPTFLIVRD
ncbi:head decoration protein [Achromobacter xylosoxidans]